MLQNLHFLNSGLEKFYLLLLECVDAYSPSHLRFNVTLQLPLTLIIALQPCS
jgi:hypothetical protein